MKVLDNKGELMEWDDALPVVKSEMFLFTRFNLPIYVENKFGGSTHTEEWLEDRFELYDKYCLPSIAKQAHENFIWVVFFDVDTPKRFVDRVAAYKTVCPQLFPVFLNKEETQMLATWTDVIVKSLKSPSELLIEIRLDNDDALNIAFIERVYRKAKEPGKTKEIISYLYGLQYYVEKNWAFRIPYADNHFLAFIDRDYDRNKAITHILQFDHSKPNAYPYSFSLIREDCCMWMENVHGQNVANEVKLTLNQKMIEDTYFLQKSFGIDICLGGGKFKVLTFILPRMAKLVCLKIRKRILKKTHY